MKNLPPWARGLIIFGIAALLLLPLVFLAIRQLAIPIRLSPLLHTPATGNVSDRYIVQSEVPGYTLTLSDSAYLDYLTGNLGIFSNTAIIDPRRYHGFRDLDLRYTVSRLRLVLVPMVDSPIVAISGTTSPSTTTWQTARISQPRQRRMECLALLVLVAYNSSPSRLFKNCPMPRRPSH